MEEAIAEARQSRNVYFAEGMLNAARRTGERFDAAQHDENEAIANFRKSLSRLQEARQVAAQYIESDALCNDQAITRAISAM